MTDSRVRFLVTLRRKFSTFVSPVTRNSYTTNADSPPVGITLTDMETKFSPQLVESNDKLQPVFLRWFPPKFDYVKINTDGSNRNGKALTYGFIARDSYGKPLTSFAGAKLTNSPLVRATSKQGIYSTIKSEMYALEAAVDFAMVEVGLEKSELKIGAIDLELDCETVVQLVCNLGAHNWTTYEVLGGDWEFVLLVEKIRKGLLFLQASISCTYREANWPTNSIVKYPFGKKNTSQLPQKAGDSMFIKTEDLPGATKEFIRLDSLGNFYVRKNWAYFSKSRLDADKDGELYNNIQVFQARIKRRRQSPNDSDNGDITKDQIISTVLDVIKLYPKYDKTRLHMPKFLMNGGHFVRDFGLDLGVSKEIVRALETEFMPDYKLEPIPQEIGSANLLVDYIYENMQSISSKGNPTEDQIYSLASVLIRVCDDLTSKATSCDHYDGLYETVDIIGLIRGLAALKTFPILSKLGLICTVFDGIQNHPGVKKLTVYHMRLYIKSVKKDDCKDDLTRNDISIRALAVIKDNPVVVDYRSKVTEDSYFHNDLNLTKNEQEEVIYGLSLEFKLDIPSNMESCKQAIDYIYDHRLTRLSLTDFDEKVGYGLVY